MPVTWMNGICQPSHSKAVFKGLTFDNFASGMRISLSIVFSNWVVLWKEISILFRVRIHSSFEYLPNTTTKFMKQNIYLPIISNKIWSDSFDSYQSHKISLIIEFIFWSYFVISCVLFVSSFQFPVCMPNMVWYLAWKVKIVESVMLKLSFSRYICRAQRDLHDQFSFIVPFWFGSSSLFKYYYWNWRLKFSFQNIFYKYFLLSSLFNSSFSLRRM